MNTHDLRVLMMVQQVDPSHWLRGFTVGWIRALAARVAHLHVLALEYNGADLPPNVTIHSMGKEHGKNRPRELARFYRALLTTAPEVDVIFSHMTPLYTVLAGPVALATRTPQVLWYTHQRVSPRLRLAERLAWRVTTAVPDSFGIDSAKARALGHGIDAGFFAPAPVPPPADDPPAVVHVARLMPIKHQATLIRALAEGLRARAVFIGADEQATGYQAELRRLAESLGVADRVTFTGGLPPAGVRDWYQRAAAAVNLSPPGLFDKAALEAMLTGVPVVVSNPAFDSLYGADGDALRIAGPEDAAGLAERLDALLRMDDAGRRALGLGLRARVAEAHSLDRLMDRLVTLFATGEPG